jgi:hypothetical protein
MFTAGCGQITHTQSCDSKSNFSIVDTHQHLWNLSHFRLPWLKPGGELTKDFTMAVYDRRYGRTYKTLRRTENPCLGAIFRPAALKPPEVLLDLGEANMV